jgi:hypothetical protein
MQHINVFVLLQLFTANALHFAYMPHMILIVDSMATKVYIHS